MECIVDAVDCGYGNAGSTAAPTGTARMIIPQEEHVQKHHREDRVSDIRHCTLVKAENRDLKRVEITIEQTSTSILAKGHFEGQAENTPAMQSTIGVTLYQM